MLNELAIDTVFVRAHVYGCRAKGRGRTLFVSYYLLSAFMTTFTSNDVAIVTLTPIIIYFSKAAKLDPLPFLMAGL